MPVFLRTARSRVLLTGQGISAGLIYFPAGDNGFDRTIFLTQSYNGTELFILLVTVEQSFRKINVPLGEFSHGTVSA